MHVLATGSPAPYDGLGATLVKVRETDGTVIIQGFAILVLRLRWRCQNRWGRLEDLDEFGLEQCELIDKMIRRIKHLFHNKYDMFALVSLLAMRTVAARHKPDEDSIYIAR